MNVNIFILREDVEKKRLVYVFYWQGALEGDLQCESLGSASNSYLPHKHKKNRRSLLELAAIFSN